LTQEKLKKKIKWEVVVDTGEVGEEPEKLVEGKIKKPKDKDKRHVGLRAKDKLKGTRGKCCGNKMAAVVGGE
jgi:hypothetical protein